MDEPPMRMFSIVRRSGRLFLVLSVLLAIANSAFPQNASETLREILEANNLPVANAKLANLEKKITDWAQLDGPHQSAIAYYLDDGTGELNPPLFVDRYDKKNKQWQSGAVPEAQKKSAEAYDICLGSIENFEASGSRLLLDTHINPSAGCLLVLSPDLKLEASLYGWHLGQVGPELLLYERSEVHFAPVHPTEIALYDLRNKRDRTIFPPETTTPIREARTAQLREFYKAYEPWCEKNDHPCDPKTFDSELQGQVATSEADSAVAFLISYEQIQFVSGDVQKPSGPRDVLYVYRGLDDPAKTEVREMLWSDAKTQFGDLPLQKLLQPPRLERIFAQAPTK
jgi:hypothetical protein